MRLLGLGTRVANLRNAISDKFTLPERFKGTVVEKWAQYWNGLVSDYAEVALGVAREARAHPRKAAITCGVTYALYECYQNNPNMEKFMLALRQSNNRMILVPKSLQNPLSAEYLRRLESTINQKRIRLMSLGLFTIVWEDLYDEDDCTYPAICEYTGVGYWNFHERIIDVGFFNYFWRLEWAMRNYDANFL